MRKNGTKHDALLYEDYILLRNLKPGETAICSDGIERNYISGTVKMGGCANMCNDLIPYGENNTDDNW